MTAQLYNPRPDRCFRFSLWWTLFAIALLAICLGPLAWTLRPNGAPSAKLDWRPESP